MQLEKKWNISIISTVIVTLAGAIIGVGVYGCKKEGPKEEDTLQSALGDELYKQTKIAFASDRAGKFEIYVINADGRKNLTNNPADDEYPTWSPDGKKLAFTSKRDGNSEVYIMNADGSEQTNLTNNSAYDGYPSWSPDVTNIMQTPL